MSFNIQTGRVNNKIYNFLFPKLIKFDKSNKRHASIIDPYRGTRDKNEGKGVIICLDDKCIESELFTYYSYQGTLPPIIDNYKNCSFYNVDFNNTSLRWFHPSIVYTISVFSYKINKDKKVKNDQGITFYDQEFVNIDYGDDDEDEDIGHFGILCISEKKSLTIFKPEKNKTFKVKLEYLEKTREKEKMFKINLGDCGIHIGKCMLQKLIYLRKLIRLFPELNEYFIYFDIEDDTYTDLNLYGYDENLNIIMINPSDLSLGIIYKFKKYKRPILDEDDLYEIRRRQ